MKADHEQAVRAFLKSRFPGYRDDLTLEDRLDSIVDSVGQFELVGFLENEFGFRLPNEDFHPDRFSTLACIGEILDRYSTKTQ